MIIIFEKIIETIPLLFSHQHNTTSSLFEINSKEIYNFLSNDTQSLYRSKLLEKVIVINYEIIHQMIIDYLIKSYFPLLEKNIEEKQNVIDFKLHLLKNDDTNNQGKKVQQFQEKFNEKEDMVKKSTISQISVTSILSINELKQLIENKTKEIK